MVRVVLDTNIIVSATILKRGHSAQILDLWREGEIEVAISPSILKEIEDVLKRPRIVKQQWLKKEEVEALIKRLGQSCVLTPGRLALRVVEEDPADDKFIVCALEAEADYIVSGDIHLRNLGEYRGIKIVPPREFLEAIRPKEN
ncbi:MAG: putative toxin-antitoxin system toxin component, PIN family [Thermoplasmata archaeon]|nr:MAG: putative toxin-antitoxin system toxin component, PIN family [Thermoplasmata archaeon]